MNEHISETAFLACFLKCLGDTEQDEQEVLE